MFPACSLLLHCICCIAAHLSSLLTSVDQWNGVTSLVVLRHLHEQNKQNRDPLTEKQLSSATRGPQGTLKVTLLNIHNHFTLLEYPDFVAK